MKEKQLNTKKIKEKMIEHGLNQSLIAAKLSTSRQSVSQWINNQKFPKPKMLLLLSRVLKLKFDEIVIDKNAPVVQFRKSGTNKTNQEHHNRAKSIGKSLNNLVKFAPFDQYSKPQTLIEPKIEYNYVQSIVKSVRDSLELINGVVSFNALINHFNDLHAVLVPVLWGNKKRHENAIHIYLPDTLTTWIYINLDAKITDFKFWMAHELGHVKENTFDGEEAEDFADRFAGALLFPEEMAERAYGELRLLSGKGKRINQILKYGEELTISPITVKKQIDLYAENKNLPLVDLNIYPAVTNFNKQIKTVSQLLFDGSTPSAKEFIKTTSEEFKTPFFDMLNKHLKENNASHGFIDRVLDISFTDSREIYSELSEW